MYDRKWNIHPTKKKCWSNITHWTFKHCWNGLWTSISVEEPAGKTSGTRAHKPSTQITYGCFKRPGRAPDLSTKVMGLQLESDKKRRDKENLCTNFIHSDTAIYIFRGLDFPVLDTAWLGRLKLVASGSIWWNRRSKWTTHPFLEDVDTQYLTNSVSQRLTFRQI